jgi:hypothetical protein
LVEGRALKNYKYFVDTFLLYQALFENSGDLYSLLHLPYPLYNDVILKQIDEKKREKRVIDEKMRNVQSKQRSTKKR